MGQDEKLYYIHYAALLLFKKKKPPSFYQTSSNYDIISELCVTVEKELSKDKMLFCHKISYSLLNTTLISPYPKDIRNLAIYENPFISLGLIKKYPCQFSLVEVKTTVPVKDSNLDPRSIFERNAELSSGGITERSCKITNKIIPEESDFYTQQN